MDADEKAGQVVDPSRDMQVSDMAAVGTNDEVVAQNVAPSPAVLVTGQKLPSICDDHLMQSRLSSKLQLQSRDRRRSEFIECRLARARIMEFCATDARRSFSYQMQQVLVGGFRCRC